MFVFCKGRVVCAGLLSVGLTAEGASLLGFVSVKLKADVCSACVP